MLQDYLCFFFQQLEALAIRQTKEVDSIQIRKSQIILFVDDFDITRKRAPKFQQKMFISNQYQF